MNRPKPVVLCILDGWGESDVREHNAILQAHTPHWDALRASCPMGLLEASEANVGLPTGQMGNSEVGHMNIGAGRIVLQDLPRIDAAVADGSLAQNAALQQFIAGLQASGGTCHLMGLVSDGGVHSHQSHMLALAHIIARAGVPVAIHAFTDGRDVSPKSAESYLKTLESALPQQCRVATISGRYYAMDRDKRWERIQLAYNTLTEANGPQEANAQAAIATAYAAGKTDEFILPTVIGNYAGMRDGDGILMTNFRADRARQLLTALLDPDFSGFARTHTPNFATSLGMAEYSAALNPLLPALFPPQEITDSLGELAAAHGLTQLRIAETEKYAHVTFFFNGGREEPFAGETRTLIPSPDVATYDLKPEMSAPEMTEKLVEAITSRTYDLIVVNYANTDMVGHSGDIHAAIKAVEAIDQCLGKLRDAIDHSGGVMMITADHGNAECLHDDDANQPHTAHTCNPVPCLLVGALPTETPRSLGRGILADIAPTLCGLLGLPVPSAMTGQNLLAPLTAQPPHA